MNKLARYTGLAAIVLASAVNGNAGCPDWKSEKLKTKTDLQRYVGKVSKFYNKDGKLSKIEKKCLADGYLQISNASEDLDEIAKYARLAIRLNPNLAGAYNNLGWHFDKSGDTERATELYNKAIDLDPEYTSARVNLGNIHLRGRDFTTAYRIFMEVLELDPEHKYAGKVASKLKAKFPTID
ncbi:MAG: tetratricopeptide repeat protein [Candidatus Nanoarchaeia archaeon]